MEAPEYTLKVKQESDVGILNIKTDVVLLNKNLSGV